MKKSLLILILAIFISCSGNRNVLTGVRIGGQVWLTENLSVTRFRNGDPVPEAKNRVDWMRMCAQGQPAWCNPINDRNNSPRYGKLYNWFAVNDPRGLAPEGWHIPSDEEWSQLTDFLGGEIQAGFLLRATAVSDSGEKETGFSGLPAGGCKGDGEYFGFGSKGYWWTSTSSNDEYAWIRQLDYVQCTINSLTYEKQCGLSVRCVKDN